MQHELSPANESASLLGGCPVCGASHHVPILSLESAPVHTNALYATVEEARAVVRAPITLALCSACGHIYNERFDPPQMQYTPAYENSLHFSPRFQHYVHDQVQSLASRYALRDKHIVDIGCGKGEFLMLLCEVAGATGVGYDPSYVADRSVGTGGVVYGRPLQERSKHKRVRFVRDYFSPQHAIEPADLICSRHVLEHIPEPQTLLQTIRAMLDGRPESVVFFEMPSADYMLQELAVWDVVYEHCGFYTRQSLAHLFERHGFEVLALAETYGGQYLTIEARPTERVVEHAGGVDPATLALAESFGERFRATVDTWQRRLTRLADEGRIAAVWGAGTKGVMFLNAVQMPDVITHVVDLNPRKQGKYVAGTGQRIVAPDVLQEAPPDQVIVMNPIYADEILAQLADLQIAAECVVA